MRKVEIPAGVEILGMTEFEHAVIVATTQGVYIVTEDGVWMRVKPSLVYGDS